MYVIVTTKPGQYHSSIDHGGQIQESYEYVFYGRLKAIYQIVLLEGESRVTITEDSPPFIRNSVPTKFLEKYATLEQARQELEHLVGFGGLEATLRRCDALSRQEA